MRKQVNHAVRRIYAIAERAGAKKNLEIGVCRDETFLNPPENQESAKMLQQWITLFGKHANSRVAYAG